MNYTHSYNEEVLNFLNNRFDVKMQNFSNQNPLNKNHYFARDENWSRNICPNLYEFTKAVHDFMIKKLVNSSRNLEDVLNSPYCGDLWQLGIFLIECELTPIELIIALTRVCPRSDSGWTDSSSLKFICERAVFSCPRVPEEILRGEARDPVRHRRNAVASNPACPLDLLERLAYDQSKEVRYSVMDHCKCTSEMKDAILKRMY